MVRDIERIVTVDVARFRAAGTFFGAKRRRHLRLLNLSSRKEGRAIESGSLPHGSHEYPGSICDDEESQVWYIEIVNLTRDMSQHEE
jgi:hypothetical protein